MVLEADSVEKKGESNMKVMEIRNEWKLDNICLGQRPEPEPGPGEVVGMRAGVGLA